jgi:hypothetical protein
MSNVIEDSTYFQFPTDVMPLLGSLKLASLRLLVLILHEAQRYSSPTIKLSTGQIVERVGLDRGSIRSAREQLQEMRLVRSVEIPTDRIWVYTLLNPKTGKDRPLPRSFRNLVSMPPNSILAYFKDRLSTGDPEPYGYLKIKARCPFHTSKASDKNFVATVTKQGGVFICHKCNVKGGMIDLEVMLAEHQENIDRKEAFRRIMSFVRQQHVLKVVNPFHIETMDEQPVEV